MNMLRIVSTYGYFKNLFNQFINHGTEEQVADPIEQADIEEVPKYPGKADNDL